MSQSEVYTALQQGVIDAAENSELVYNDFKNYEVAKYYSHTKHIVHPDVVIASTEFLDSMSESDRAIFDQLVSDSTEYEFTTFKERIEQAKAEVEGHGTQEPPDGISATSVPSRQDLPCILLHGEEYHSPLPFPQRSQAARYPH